MAETIPNEWFISVNQTDFPLLLKSNQYVITWYRKLVSIDTTLSNKCSCLNKPNIFLGAAFHLSWKFDMPAEFRRHPPIFRHPSASCCESAQASRLLLRRDFPRGTCKVKQERRYCTSSPSSNSAPQFTKYQYTRGSLARRGRTTRRFATLAKSIRPCRA